MRAQPVAANQNRRIVAGIPFVEALARRMAATMPNSIDLGDLVQDGVIGLIDAAHRFDEDRGIKFETFAERRVRGAMIDALRRDAWPRGVRRQRRELDAAREALRRELGHEPSHAELAARVGSDEKRLSRTILRINTIESTSPLATGEHMDESSLPAALVPSEPEAPDTAYEKLEMRERVRTAIQTLPWREQKVIGLYYYGEVTMKQIGAEIGVNESRVSQLHARAIRRLREALGDMNPEQVAEMRLQLVTFAAEAEDGEGGDPGRAEGRVARWRRVAVQAASPSPCAASRNQGRPHAPGASRRQDRRQPDRNTKHTKETCWFSCLRVFVVASHASTSPNTRNNSPSLNGFASQRQPLCSRKVSASVPATSPVTKMTRLARPGVPADSVL